MSPLDPSANCAKIFRDITSLAEQGRIPEQFIVGPFTAAHGTVTAALQVQNPVSKLQAVWNPTANGVSLTWTKSLQSVSSFMVTRSSFGTTNSTGVGNGSSIGIDTTSQTTYLDTTVQPGVTYKYSIQALKSNGQPYSLSPVNNSK